jgi:hypothetical protein
LVLLPEDLCEIESVLDNGFPAVSLESELSLSCFNDRWKLEEVACDNDLVPSHESVRMYAVIGMSYNLDTAKRFVRPLGEETSDLAKLVEKVRLHH